MGVIFIVSVLVAMAGLLVKASETSAEDAAASGPAKAVALPDAATTSGPVPGQKITTVPASLAHKATTASLATLPRPRGVDHSQMKDSYVALLKEFGIYPTDLFSAFRLPQYTPEEKQELEARKHYFLGQYYLMMDEYSHALGEFRAALEVSPGNPEILFAIADAQMSAKQFEEAEKVLDRILEDEPGNVRALLAKAQVLMGRTDVSTSKRREMLDKAVSLLEKAKKSSPNNLDVLKAIASAYFAQQNIDKIIQAHRDILSVNPKDTYSLLVLANLLARTGRHREAIGYYERVIEQRRGYINTYVYLAQLYEEIGSTADAIATCKRALLIEPRNEQLLKRFDSLVEKAAGNRGRRGVLTYYEQFAKEYPFSSEVQRLFADELSKADELDRAVKQYARVLELDSENVDALVALGRLHMQQKNIDEANRCFLKAVEISPDKVDVYESIAAGMLSQDPKNLDRAADIYRKAIELNPKVDKLYSGLATLYYKMSKYDDAEKVLRQGLEKAGEKPELLAMLGQVLEKSRQLGAAIDAFQKASDLAPQNKIVQLKLLSLMIRDKRQEQVDELTSRVLSVATDKTELCAMIGETFFSELDLKNAITWYEKALQQSPQLVIISRLTQLYIVTGQYDKCMNMLLQAKESLRSNEEIDRLRGDVCLARKDYAAAIDIYAGIVLGKPDSLDGYRLLADALNKAERYDEALACVRKAEERLGRGNEDVAALRGIVLYQQKRYPAAERVFRSLLQKKSKDSDVHYYFLGSIYLDQKRYELAERNFRKALEINPINDSVLNALGYMLADINTRLPEAKELVEKALEINPNAPHILDSMGWVYYRMGDLDKALELVQKSHVLMGDDPEVLDHLGDIYKARGDIATALQYWKRSAQLDEKRTQARSKIEEHEKQEAR